MPTIQPLEEQILGGSPTLVFATFLESGKDGVLAPDNATLFQPRTWGRHHNGVLQYDINIHTTGR